MADLQDLVPDSDDAVEAKTLIENHLKWTASKVAAEVLDNWDDVVRQFKKVMPRDYARVLREQAEAESIARLNGETPEYSLNGGTVATPALAGRAV